MYILHENKTPKEKKLTIIGLLLIVVGSMVTVFI
ncbi:sugar transporter, partial [Enterococcus faecium]|nr:sugar transporter [Enterococcus faecium]